jgi:hypothetical protein
MIAPQYVPAKKTDFNPLASQRWSHFGTHLKHVSLN